MVYIWTHSLILCERQQIPVLTTNEAIIMYTIVCSTAVISHMHHMYVFPINICSSLNKTMTRETNNNRHHLSTNVYIYIYIYAERANRRNLSCWKHKHTQQHRCFLLLTSLNEQKKWKINIITAVHHSDCPPYSLPSIPRYIYIYACRHIAMHVPH